MKRKTSTRLCKDGCSDVYRSERGSAAAATKTAAILTLLDPLEPLSS
jgi:hypothetical protein